MKSHSDTQPYYQEWIAALAPIKWHPDTALYLGVQQLHSGKLLESVLTLVDAAEALSPGRWNDIYATILQGVDKPKFLRTLTGWICQKPERRARERDEVKIEEWRKRDWPRIKKGDRA